MGIGDEFKNAQIRMVWWDIGKEFLLGGRWKIQVDFPVVGQFAEKADLGLHVQQVQ